MDLDLDDTESQLQSACAALLQRYAGAARAKSLLADGRADRTLAQHLEQAGFLDLFRDQDAGPVVAALVTEQVAEAAGVLPIGARALVGPALAESLPLLLAIAEEGRPVPVRFGAQADALLLVGDDEVRLLQTGGWDSSPEPSKYGYPLARVHPTAPGRVVGSAETARRWWRVALAAEIAGTASAAVGLTTRYLKERHQFGRPIGSFQSLQHRMAECLVQVEGVRWLAREAADLGAPAALSASAAVAAAQAAQQVAQEVHQLTGAMGFTLDYDLHVWSLRLQSLRVEAGGINAHAEALVRARWR
jgi:alkylation response protein AidB-like acyl-CoA dehydrogenase